MTIQVLPSVKNVLNAEGCLRNYISAREYKKIFLVSGNLSAGKKTLIHYLLRKKLEPDVSEDGQQVLNIIEHANKITIIPELLELYPEEQTQRLYIWFNGYPNDEMDLKDQLQWSLTFEYLANTLITFERSIGFLLVFSLFEEDLPLLMLNFKKNFRIYQKFTEKSAFILSKLADESEVSQFTEMTAIDMIESNQQLQFINEILGNNAIFPFYNRDPEEEEINTLHSNLDNLFTQSKISFHQDLKENFIKEAINDESEQIQLILNKALEEVKQKIVAGLETLNASFCQILFSIAEINVPPAFITNFTSSASKLTEGKQVKFEVDAHKLKQNSIKESLFSFYEKSREVFADNPNQFLRFFMKNIKTIEQAWGKSSKDSCCIEYLEQNWIFFLAFLEQKQTFQNKFTELFQFTNANSYLSDVVLSNIFQRVKNFLSKSFIEKNSEAIKSPKKIGGIKKIIQKPKFEDYESQKRKAQGLSIDKILNLPQSPLKLDLLLNELKKKILSKKSGQTREIKILINRVTTILDLYEEYESSAMLFSVIPDFHKMEKSLQLYCKKAQRENKLKKRKFSKEQLDFIQKVLKKFYLGKKLSVYDASQVCGILQESRYSDGEKKQRFRKQIKELYNENNDVKKLFMETNFAEEVFKEQKKLIQRCLEYEQNNWQKKFQDYLVLKDGLVHKSQ